MKVLGGMGVTHVLAVSAHRNQQCGWSAIHWSESSLFFQQEGLCGEVKSRLLWFSKSVIKVARKDNCLLMSIIVIGV